MTQHRKVPQIGRGPQSFSQRAQLPVPSPMQPPPMNPVQQAMASPFQTIQNIPAPVEPVYSVEQDIQDLAMEIYARLAVDHIRSNYTPDRTTLKSLARSSQVAAIAYFEALGATIEGDQPNGQQ